MMEAHGMLKTLTIVVPCYNEEEVLPETVKEIGTIIEDLIAQAKISTKSKILFVNDGSKDRTWELGYVRIIGVNSK